MEIDHTKRKLRPWIIDTTLRDGEQSPGVSFDQQSKLKIAEKLSEAGIDELEVGVPAMGRAAQNDIRRISALGLGCTLSVWCRALKDDLEAAMRCHVAGVHISFPVSRIHLAAIGKDQTWVLKQLKALVQYASGYFDRISIGAQDATRADRAFLISFAQHAQAAGVRRLRFADTVGIGFPETIDEQIQELRREAKSLDIEFHGHNDLGLASANTLAALLAGAQAASVTVNGLGERAGNAALEQLAMVLDQHTNFHCPLDTSHLVSLCRRVAKAAGRPIGPTQPVVGENVFTHESGIHCHAMLRDSRAYEPFSPYRVGRANRRYELGSHSGTAAIRHLLKKAGIPVSRKQAMALIPLLCRSEG